MNLQSLAKNIRRLRTAKRLSQRTLAERAALSPPSVKNLELAKTQPRMRTVQAIARALDVPIQELFLPVRELRTVRFRSGKRMLNRENILAQVSRWLDDFNYLEQILDEHRPFLLKELRVRCSRDDIAAAAELCRNFLGLKPTEPIHDLCGLLEHAGIKIYPLSCASEGFFGLSIAEEDGGPAIVVNVWERITVERHIFSAAHELGHLMLHRDTYSVDQTEENKEQEQEADLFAGRFLLPDQGFRREWNDAAGLHWVDRVFKVKRIFRVSYKTVLTRLKEYGLADDSIWKKFNLAYQSRFKRTLAFKEEPLGIEPSEPYRLQPFDFYEDRISRLTRLAVEEDKISLSRGAEILRIGVEEMQDLLKNWGSVL